MHGCFAAYELHYYAMSVLRSYPKSIFSAEELVISTNCITPCFTCKSSLLMCRRCAKWLERLVKRFRAEIRRTLSRIICLNCRGEDANDPSALVQNLPLQESAVISMTNGRVHFWIYEWEDYDFFCSKCCIIGGIRQIASGKWWKWKWKSKLNYIFFRRVFFMLIFSRQNIQFESVSYIFFRIFFLVSECMN